jgi:tetratricopeptide (TPR) repeat protein
MWFNLSCVLSKVGRRDEAVAALRTAVRGDEKYADEAKADDYMEALFGDPEFEAICALDPSALRTAEERDPAWVKGLIARARDEQQAGDLQRGLATATRAAGLAEALGDRAVLVEALAVLGRMQAFAGSIDDALATSARAIDLAGDEAVPPDVRAVAYAQRGICMQAVGSLDEAEAAYERAFEERRAAFGEKHPSLVKSLVSIVGVALARERPATEVEALITRGVDIAQAYLERDVPADHVWAETIDDLVSLLFRRSLLRASDPSADAVAPLALALDRLEQQRRVGFAPMATVVDQLREQAEALAANARSPEVARAALEVQHRAEAMLVPGPPEERPTRLYFRRLRRWIDELRRQGVDEARIAGVLSDAVRGTLPDELRQIPLLAELRNLIAEASARESTVLVTSAMALSMAGLPGELDESLRQLEELVAPILAAG